jgi:hypothetical protein
MIDLIVQKTSVIATQAGICQRIQSIALHLLYLLTRPPAKCAGAIFLVSLLLSFPVYAASKCYTVDQATAEQGIRIHSELMVIGLNCQHRTPTGQKNYYAQYKELTAKNGKLFASYETTLLDYFKDTGSKDAEGRLNALRTGFANKISGDAAKMRPDLFCAYYAPRIPKAAAMTTAQLDQWARIFFKSHPVSQPFCKGVTVEMR